MTITEQILAVDWHNFDTAYGNAAMDIPCYVPSGDGRGTIPSASRSLLALFSDSKKAALQASHDLWCGLCHQYAFVSSAALPAYDILFYGLQNLDDDLKVEILDIITGFSVCISKDAPKDSWQGRLRAKLERDRPYYQSLTSHPNEDLAGFAEHIAEKL